MAGDCETDYHEEHTHL